MTQWVAHEYDSTIVGDDPMADAELRAQGKPDRLEQRLNDETPRRPEVADAIVAVLRAVGQPCRFSDLGHRVRALVGSVLSQTMYEAALADSRILVEDEAV